MWHNFFDEQQLIIFLNCKSLRESMKLLKLDKREAKTLDLVNPKFDIAGHFKVSLQKRKSIQKFSFLSWRAWHWGSQSGS